MQPTRFILVRHANTASNGFNPDPLMSGWTDLPLTDLGRAQVLALRERFMDESPFTAIYSSPLQRALCTALPLRDLCSCQIQLCNELRELNCGAVDGLPISEVQDRWPNLWSENLRQENPDFRWPDGESYQELRARSFAALDRISRQHPGECVLVVTHCGVISQLAGALQGFSPARWESFRVQNTSISELHWSGDDRRFTRFDDAAHLARLVSPLQT